MHVISIQSRVTWGYVGNAVAIPILQAQGLDASPIDTVRLSHHPGHGKPWGTVAPADEVGGLLSGALGMIDGPVTILMGYLGSALQGETLMNIIDAERGHGRDIELFMDPAFGDTAEGVYVDDEIVAFFKRAAAKADVLMPNAFEFGVLTAGPIDSADAAVRAFNDWADGPGEVLVSSVPAGGGDLATLLLTRRSGLSVRHQAVQLSAKGTGDLLSAAFTSLRIQGSDGRDALGAASAIVGKAVQDAANHNRPELDLISLLPELVTVFHNSLSDSVSRLY